MMTIASIGGLIALLGMGMFWAVRVGKKMNRLEQMEKGQKVVKELADYNKYLDKKEKVRISSNGDPVRGAWLRERD